jgi:hypothetical protein
MQQAQSEGVPFKKYYFNIRANERKSFRILTCPHWRICIEISIIYFSTCKEMEHAMVNKIF